MHNFCISMDKAWHLGITVIYAAVKTYPSEEFEVYNFDFTVLLCVTQVTMVNGTLLGQSQYMAHLFDQQTIKRISQFNVLQALISDNIVFRSLQ